MQGKLKGYHMQGKLKGYLCKENLRDTLCKENLRDTICKENLRDTICKGNLRDTLCKENLRDILCEPENFNDILADAINYQGSYTSSTKTFKGNLLAAEIPLSCFPQEDLGDSSCTLRNLQWFIVPQKTCRATLCAPTTCFQGYLLGHGKLSCITCVPQKSSGGILY